MRLVALLAAALISAQRAQPAGPPVIDGLDHVPIIVNDLEKAAERYRGLGFTLKPGTPHDNGIRNVHAKFANGTELELITAPAARDALTTTYRRHLAQGEGPAFLALFAPDMTRLVTRLDSSNVPHGQAGRTLDLRDSTGLPYIFFGPRNASPTDKPEHFVHANTAQSLIAVWLAADDLDKERGLLQTVGARIVEEALSLPEPVRAPVGHLPEGDVVLLPAARQIVKGHRIAGVTLRVQNVDTAVATLARGGWTNVAITPTPRGRSLFIPPTIAHGLWIELRERPTTQNR